MTDRVRPNPGCSTFLALGVVLTAILFTVVLLPRYPGLFFDDDSFFYLKIADHLASGQGSTFDGVNPTNGYHPLYLGLWMKENLPPGTRVFQVNGSGFTGYFSQRPVINGDGLVNSWEYQKYLRSGRLIDYLRENDIQYIIWDQYHGEDNIEIRVPLWNRPPLVLSFSEPPEQIVRAGRFVLLKPSLDRIILNGS